MASFETGGSYFCSSSAAFRFFMTAAAAAARTSLPVLWRRPLRPLPSINKCYVYSSNPRFIHLNMLSLRYCRRAIRSSKIRGFFGIKIRKWNKMESLWWTIPGTDRLLVWSDEASLSSTDCCQRRQYFWVDDRLQKEHFQSGEEPLSPTCVREIMFS